MEALAAAKEDASLLDQPRTLELEMVRKDGRTVWVEVRTSFLRDHDGNRMGILGITRDISDRLLAERALRRSEQRYRLLIETTGDWVWEIDAEGRYTYASPRIKDLLNYRPEEVLGKTPYDLMPPDEAKRMAPLFRRIASRRVPFVGAGKYHAAQEWLARCRGNHGMRRFLTPTATSGLPGLRSRRHRPQASGTRTEGVFGRPRVDQ